MWPKHSTDQKVGGSSPSERATSARTPWCVVLHVARLPRLPIVQLAATASRAVLRAVARDRLPPALVPVTSHQGSALDRGLSASASTRASTAVRGTTGE